LLLDGEQLCPDAMAVNYLSLQGGANDTVSLRDECSGETLQVRPRVLINATGAWIDLANRALGYQTKMIGGTKGAHLVMNNDDLMKTFRGGMIYYETHDGRVSIALPWLGKALIGSTDIRVDDPDTVRCEDDEIDYMLEAIREVLPKLKIDRSQIVSTFSGVRPLQYSEGKSTVQISRDHHCTVIEPSNKVRYPVYCLIGGKWTTFRAFAEHVTDRLMKYLGRSSRVGTEEVPIGGGKDYPTGDDARRAWLGRLQQQTGLAQERLVVLLDRYGTRAQQVAGFLTEGADRPLEHHAGYSRREIEFIIRHEGVVHLDDLLLRRTAIALLGELTNELLAEIAQIAAGLKQWSDEQTRKEIDRAAEILRTKHRIDLQRPAG
jgi:glycerol-3-phosphate dehydrogenase